MIHLEGCRREARQRFASAWNRREFNAKVCVRNLHTAHFWPSDGRCALADRQLPLRSLICTIADRLRGGGVEVETQIQEDSAMPDVQISPTAETRDYLNITETADRSRLAVKTLYIGSALADSDPAKVSATSDARL